MDLPNITSPVYKPTSAPESGAVNTYNDLVHSYLNLVQPNPFPPGFLSQLITQNFTHFEYKEVLVYEVGYLVAIAIGILFIILMPIVGFFFSCCRCCGNCGGKMHQKQTKQINYKRRFLYIFLFLITLIILAGDICAFLSNNRISTAVNESFDSLNNTLDNLKTYINSVPKEVDIIINASDTPILKANSSIIGIGTILGGMILAQIGKTANATLDSVVDITKALNSTAMYMTAVNNSFNSLQDQQQILHQNLSDVKKEISQTLNSCGSACDPKPNVDDLAMDANFSTIPDFTDQMKLINNFLNSGIDSTIQKAYKSLNDIPETVTNQTRDTVTKVQKQLGDIKDKIQNIRSKIPIVDSINNVNNQLDEVLSSITKYKSEITNGDKYRWIAGICLSCLVLLVVVCNFFGLLLGPCGHNPKVDPTERGCASNSGGNFFMAGTGFSFIYSWLLMVVVTVLFIIGGNSYTLICKPWSNQQLFTYLDTPNLIPQLNLSKYLNGTNATISSLYRDCHNNYSLWSTLDLNRLFNLDAELDISKYTGEVNKTLNDTEININNITFIDNNQKQLAKNVSESGIDNHNFSDINQQTSKNITKTDLIGFAKQLEDLANKTSNATVSKELRDEANTLKQIQSSINTNLVTEIHTLNKSINNLEALSKTIPGMLNTTLEKVANTQIFLDTKASEIVKNESSVYLNILLGYFQTYVTYAKNMLTKNVARCGPVAKAIDSAHVILCVNIVDSLNAFWFSLGWCTIFFIPSIIASVKLAKYYRRMKSSDVFEDNGVQLEMTTASQQFLIPRVTTKS
ncbi:prominin-1-A [Bombina bombina]|uniref:prominin-1-A n=1 Tax=Bombina bombina TaxID=8345 RepID=UPI00235A4B5B|nr:prominin-1-A [Bombina bombina]XP_053548467.1 prominin-1-A [Bombina bombina]XP_053548468.1 prominin-1-A [Bombina bombina]